MEELGKIQEKHYSEKMAGRNISEELEYMNEFARDNYPRLALAEELFHHKKQFTWSRIYQTARKYFEVKKNLAEASMELTRH